MTDYTGPRRCECPLAREHRNISCSVHKFDWYGINNLVYNCTYQTYNAESLLLADEYRLTISQLISFDWSS